MLITAQKQSTQVWNCSCTNPTRSLLTEIFLTADELFYGHAETRSSADADNALDAFRLGLGFKVRVRVRIRDR